MIHTEINDLRACIEATLIKLDTFAKVARSELHESSEVGTSVFRDELDSAKAAIDLGTTALIYNQNIKNQNGLLNALTRMKDGTFETCITCGDEIGMERLNAHPSAFRCIDCQEFVEMGSYANIRRPAKVPKETVRCDL